MYFYKGPVRKKGPVKFPSAMKITYLNEILLYEFLKSKLNYVFIGVQMNILKNLSCFCLFVCMLAPSILFNKSRPIFFPS